VDAVDGVFGLEDFGRFPEAGMKEEKFFSVLSFVRPDLST